MRKFLAAMATAAVVLGAEAAQAANVVLDQIQPTEWVYASQDFETDLDAFDAVVIDDFMLSGTYDLTSFSALIALYGTGSMSAVTNWQVNFYSSVSAAEQNLVGDLGSFNFAPGKVTFSASPGGEATDLVTAPINLRLGAGTYWVGFIPRLDFAVDQIGVGLYGTGDAYNVNPNGGFGFGTTDATGLNAGYRLEGTPAVPEPATWAFMIGGFGLVGAALRRRQVVLA